MLQIPSEMQARLAAGATTLAWCWRVTRRDGVVFGFTDHDETLVFEDVSFSPDSGFTGSEVEARLGRESAASEIAGLFDDAAISEADLKAGLWDGARVEIFRVDWRDVSLRVKTWTGETGAVSHDGTSFRTELNGLTRRLDRSVGRIYARHCDASFGDARCGLDATMPDYRGNGVVSAISPAGLIVDGLDGYADDWFTAGWLDWTSGSLAGKRVRVEFHSRKPGQVRLSVDGQETAGIGDAFTITAGCDKRHASCRDKFANILNFRGFAFLPGNDVLMASPAADARRDGGSRGLAP